MPSLLHFLELVQAFNWRRMVLKLVIMLLQPSGVDIVDAQSAQPLHRTESPASFLWFRQQHSVAVGSNVTGRTCKPLPAFDGFSAGR